MPAVLVITGTSDARWTPRRPRGRLWTLLIPPTNQATAAMVLTTERLGRIRRRGGQGMAWLSCAFRLPDLNHARRGRPASRRECDGPSASSGIAAGYYLPETHRTGSGLLGPLPSAGSRQAWCRHRLPSGGAPPLENGAVGDGASGGFLRPIRWVVSPVQPGVRKFMISCSRCRFSVIRTCSADVYLAATFPERRCVHCSKAMLA